MKGADAEDRALHYLQRQGLTLVQRNFRARGGEIDLVMRERDLLVLVEVRKRSSARYGDAAESVDARKRGRIVLAAQHYLLRWASPPPCRFDVVAIDGETIEWLKGAFDAS